ncbi:hypothetical protein ACOMHN_021462 [Nucella lapillus]
MKSVSFPRIFLIISAVSFNVLQGSDDVIRIKGDVMLASLFEVNEANSDGTCGAFDLTEVRNAYAVQWFVEKLNKRNYINGVKIGLESWRTCYSRSRAVQAVFGLMDRYVTNTSNSPTPLAGIIGPSQSERAVAVSELISSLPENQRVPQVSCSATGRALSNKTVYPNFFRVIPPDDAQIQVIIELLTTLRWNYIAIVYTDEEYGRTAAATLLEETHPHGICVPVYASIPPYTSSRQFDSTVERIVENMKGKASAGISSDVLGAVFIGGVKEAGQFAKKLEDGANFVELIFAEALDLQTSAMKVGKSYIGVTKGALTVTPQYKEVEEFRQAWNDLWKHCFNLPLQVINNPWLNSLQNKFSGNCSQLQFGPREQSLYTWYHIQAAAMFAAALKSFHSKVCTTLSGPCPDFVNRVQNYENVRNLWRVGLNLDAEFVDVVGSFKGMRNVSLNASGEVMTNSSQPLYEVHNYRPCLDDDKEYCFTKVGER